MNYFFLTIAMVFLAGCNPFNGRQLQTEEAVAKADREANASAKAYKPDIRDIEVYEPYRYVTEIKDPFRARKFFVAEQEPVIDSPTQKCEPPECSPPTPHEKSFLEDYSLDDLAFVGTLNKVDNIGLIKTPDVGVVRVKEGDYIGRNNGKILAIEETVIIIQEKFYNGGVWEDKKAKLPIN